MILPGFTAEASLANANWARHLATKTLRDASPQHVLPQLISGQIPPGLCHCDHDDKVCQALCQAHSGTDPHCLVGCGPCYRDPVTDRMVRTCVRPDCSTHSIQC